MLSVKTRNKNIGNISYDPELEFRNIYHRPILEYRNISHLAYISHMMVCFAFVLYR